MILRKIVNFRWIGLVVAYAVAVGGWTWVVGMKDVYTASARVYVDTDNVLRPLMKGLSVEGDVLNDVAVMTRAIKSRPQLEEVARDADLDIGAATQQQFDGIIKYLDTQIKIVGDRQNIFEITFPHYDRSVALNVVSNLVNRFVEDVVGSGHEDSEQAERAIQTELNDYEARLIKAEDDLKRFKQANVGLMPGDRGDYYEQLQASQSQMAGLQARQRQINNRLRILQRQIGGEAPVFGIMSGSDFGEGQMASRYDAEISRLVDERNRLLLSLTDRHPDVVQIANRLKILEDKRDQELARMPAQPLAPRPGATLETNPVYQNLRIQLNDAEIELATVESQIAEQQATRDRLAELVDVVPQKEAELVRLNRDYEVIYNRHQALLERWEILQTSKRLKSGTDQIRFRIIDPPFAPLTPSWPPRGLLLIAILIGALGAGAVTAFGLTFLRPVYSSVTELSALGLNVLGSLTESGPRGQPLRWAHFAAAVCVLCLIPVGIFVVIIVTPVA